MQRLLKVFVAVLVPALAFAQLHGRVIDAEGDPVPGVVVAHGTEIDTTDVNGDWELYGVITSVPEGAPKVEASWGEVKTLFRGAGSGKRASVADTLRFTSADHWDAAHFVDYAGGDVGFDAALPANIYSPAGVPWSGVEVLPDQAQQIWGTNEPGEDIELWHPDSLPITVDGTFRDWPDSGWAIDSVQATIDQHETQTGIDFFEIGDVSWATGDPDGIYWRYNSFQTGTQPYHANGFMTGAEVFTTISNFRLPNIRAHELGYRATHYGFGNQYPDGIFKISPWAFTDFNAAHIRVIYKLQEQKIAGTNQLKLSGYRPAWVN